MRNPTVESTRSRVTRGNPPFIDLRGVSILSGLNEIDLKRIKDELRLKSVPAGSAMVPSSEVGSLFIVNSGLFDLNSVTQRGEMFRLRRLRPGEWYGPYAILAEIEFIHAAAVACEDSSYLELCGAKVMSFARELPDFGFALLTSACRTIISMSDRLLEFGTLGLRERLMSELLRLAKMAVADGSMVTVRKAPTHEALAITVGATREAVSRELRRLAQQGLITTSRECISIVDIDIMQQHLLSRLGRRPSEELSEIYW